MCGRLSVSETLAGLSLGRDEYGAEAISRQALQVGHRELLLPVALAHGDLQMADGLCGQLFDVLPRIDAQIPPSNMIRRMRFAAVRCRTK